MRRRGGYKKKISGFNPNGLIYYSKLETTALINEYGADGTNSGGTAVAAKLGNGFKSTGGNHANLGSVLSGLTEFAIGFWFKVTTVKSHNALIGTSVNGVTIRAQTNDSMTFQVFADEASAGTGPIHPGGYSDAFHFGIFEYVSDGGLFVRLDDVQYDYPTLIARGSVPASNTYIGKNTTAFTGENIVDNLFVYNRLLTTAEKNYWWNDGNGIEL